jgi:putative Mn2+ efflux pump MntP
LEIAEYSLLGVGLAMDAFAAAICKGLSIKKNFIKNGIIVALFFGFFQALMPFIGYKLAETFAESLKAIDHWIAFVLLVLIGVNMIRESRDKTCDIDSGVMDFKSLFMLSIATSIDALAVGISFAFLDKNIYYGSATIGIITFFISLIGVKIGRSFGIKFKDKAQIAGGLVLIFLGTKILFEHLGIIA